MADSKSKQADSKSKPKHGNLWMRVATGVPLALAAIGLMWLGGLWFTLLVAAAVWFAVSELGIFLRRSGVEPQWYTAVVCTVGLTACAHFCSYDRLAAVLLLSILAVCAGEVLRFPKRRLPISGASSTIFLIMYCGWFPAHAVLLRRLQASELLGLETVSWSDMGLVLVGLLLLTCIATDVGAYAFGKMLGRHRLCPQVSPGKTVEGSLGGIALALLLSWGWSIWTGFPLVHCLVMTGVGSAAAQFGDLFESALKRQIGVKDSGNLLAGHGGALDRLDSFLFTVPFFYIYVCLFLFKH